MAFHLLCTNYMGTNLIDALRLLIENGMDVNAKTNNGSSTLHCLCSFPVITNLFGIVRLLLDSGIDVNAINSCGFTGLYYLCDTYSGHDLLGTI